MTKMELLGLKYVADILVYVRDTPDMTYGEIIYAVSECKGGERTIYLRLEDLRHAGLINTDSVRTGTTQCTVRLTDYGERIAEKMAELKEAVGE